MHAITRRSLVAALALASLLAIPAPVAAQQASTLTEQAPATPAAAPAAGPTVEQATAGVRAPAASEQQLSAAAAQSRAGLGTARAQMIVGFAALVAGALIGDTPGTIIMIGGAILGLWGLYNYLQ